MNLKELHDQWDKDNTIDRNNLASESANVPKLHNKYYLVYAEQSKVLNKLKRDYKKVVSIKSQYYRGELNNKEDLEKYGWEPQRKKVLKNDVPSHLDNDEDVMKIKEKLDEQEQMYLYLGEIISQINSRGWQIKNIIDWERWRSGG